MTNLPPFWSLVEEHGDELLGYARRLSGPDAEDVVQEAFLKALRSYPNLKHGDHLRGWLYRITTTCAFDRSAKRGREVPVDAVPDHAVDGAFPDEGFELLIEGLPGGSHHAMQLRFVEDLTYEEMAKRMGCTPAAARQRVSGAIKKLRERL